MFTTLMYEAERQKTAAEQREFYTRNGEMAAAVRRPFRKLRTRIQKLRPQPRRLLRSYSQQPAACPCDCTATQARCG